MEASSWASEGQQSRATAAGGTVCKKAVARGKGGPIANHEHCQFPVHSFPSGHSIFTQTLRVYAFALIVRSRAVDAQHTENMIKKEEKARQHFEELKDILLKLSPRWWKKDFKSYIDKFIEKQLEEKEAAAEMLCENKEEEEPVCMYLHGLRRLVAGAAQE